MVKRILNSHQKIKKVPYFRQILFLLFLLLSGVTANNLNAQESISGQVTDEFGEVLIGATIVQKGTTNGNITDIDGNYSIVLIPGERILECSYTGFESQEITLGSSTIVNIVLKSSSNELDEVVVIGYAPVQREKILGAMASAA